MRRFVTFLAKLWDLHLVWGEFQAFSGSICEKVFLNMFCRCLDVLCFVHLLIIFNLFNCMHVN